MSDDIDDMIDVILEKEGGFVNHPDDPGGATNMGITIGTLSKWRGRTATIDDVRKLTEREARKIYKRNYYIVPNMHELDPPLNLNVFDMGVNAGPRRAIKILQECVNDAGGKLKEDGLLGLMTLAEVWKHDNIALNNDYVEARCEFYNGLANSRPKLKVFLKGWLKRARSFRR